jgi:hypothetical protein
MVAARCVDHKICFGSVFLDDSIVIETKFDHFNIVIEFLKFRETLCAVSAGGSDMEPVP